MIRISTDLRQISPTSMGKAALILEGVTKQAAGWKKWAEEMK